MLSAVFALLPDTVLDEVELFMEREKRKGVLQQAYLQITSLIF